MSLPWSDFELRVSIEAYLKMLKYEEDKTPYVKAEINRQTMSSLPDRTDKSLEYRWQNISAVLNNHKLPFILGFKPANNVGSYMEEKIWKLIEKHRKEYVTPRC